MAHWISVDKRLPEPSETMHLVKARGSYVGAKFLPASKSWMKDGLCDITKDVTHWLCGTGGEAGGLESSDYAKTPGTYDGRLTGDIEITWLPYDTNLHVDNDDGSVTVEYEEKPIYAGQDPFDR